MVKGACRVAALFSTLAVPALGQQGQGADGNPHGWDRRRRCDGTMYSPVCGICEGYGGIPYGDDNDEIHLSNCTPAVDYKRTAPLIHPVWSSRMTMDPYYAIQIGPKIDPFCFQAIPGNQSNGELCYQAQTGTQVYEMGEYNLLRFDVNLATPVGNVTSAVYAQDQYLWIVNHLPWYALGIVQCICTSAHQGADRSKNPVYPLQYNWTDQMYHIGIETIFVEYIWTTMTLDHWVYGPHHVWAVPETGSIIRMWQPFNGLQVFPNGTLTSHIDPADFAPIPPEQCTSADHFSFKIKCNDSGYPAPSTVETPARLPSIDAKESEGASQVDSGMWRAKQKVPRHNFKGDSFAEMGSVLNEWIVDAYGHDGVRSCDDWNVTELQKLQAMLYMLRYPAYDEVYHATEDNRRIDGSIEQLMSDWAKLNQAAEEAGLEDMHRDGHCHEAVMWYTHHLQEDAKVLLNKQGVKLPLLSHTRHECETPSTDAHAAVCASYDYQVSCFDCHSNVRPPASGRRLSMEKIRSLLKR